MRTMA